MRELLSKLSCVLILVLVLISCGEAGSSKSSASADTIHSDKTVTIVASDKVDSLEITTLLRNMYRWYETKNTIGEFSPTTNTSKDTLYIGIDWKKHNNRLKQLKETGFFANDFLDNYQKIAVYIDSQLKDGSTQWYVGEISPFEPDANAWCNCQDNPEKYWEKLTIFDIHTSQELTTCKWTWGDDFSYSVAVKKENGLWKIAYLDGFDFKNYSMEN